MTDLITGLEPQLLTITPELTGNEPMLTITRKDLWRELSEQGWIKVSVSSSDFFGVKTEYVFSADTPEPAIEYFIALHCAKDLARCERDGRRVTVHVPEQNYDRYLALHYPDVAEDSLCAMEICYSEGDTIKMCTACDPNCVRYLFAQLRRAAIEEAKKETSR